MWSTIFTIVLQLLGWVLQRYSQDIEAHKNFLEFVEKMAAKGLVSASLNDSYNDQRKKNLDEISKLNQS